jgi:predicted nucleotidyltransferase
MALYLLFGRKSFPEEGTPSLSQPHVRPTASSALYYPLDEILGSPALVRVLRVLADHGASLGVSDIARRTRLALPSTRAAIRRLLSAELLTGVGAGRSMVCALRNEHPLAGALTALFAAERQQADEVLGAIRLAAAGLRPQPLGVWLYGSVARAEDTPASDVDIAMVSGRPEPSEQAEALREAIATALPGREHRVSVIAFAPADVRRLAAEGAEIWTELLRDAAVLVGDAPAGVLERVSAEEPST